MASNNPSLVVLGHVERVEGSSDIAFPGEADGWRLKVRLDSDGDTAVNDLPDAFPLLPKTLQSVPKKGEGVFILTAALRNNKTQRFYIGPIISQPQYFEKCPFDYNRGAAVSLLSNSKLVKPAPLTSIQRAKGLTKGSFPELDDVAILGRGQEDIIFKYKAGQGKAPTTSSEVDIRAGIRLKPSDTSIKYVQGNVVFNSVNPTYIQVKHKQAGIAGLNGGDGDSVEDKYESPKEREANSVVNVVADKINLISHKDSAQFGEKIADRDQLVLEEELDNIMSQLHRSVYGDKLITLLKLIVKALTEHTHPYSMMPPTIPGTSLEDLVAYNYEKIISPNVRIS